MQPAPSKLTFSNPGSSGGFTLIELLVVIAIIGVLTGGAIAAYSNFNRGQTVRRAAETIKSDIRAAQNNAVSGAKTPGVCKVDEYNNETGDAGADRRDDHILVGHYVIFTADSILTPDSNSYNIGERCLDDYIDVSESYVDVGPDSTPLPPGVFVSGTTVDSVSRTPLTINFKALRGVDFYEGTQAAIGPTTPLGGAQAIITVTDGTTTHEVEVTSSGQITVR